MLKMTLEEFDTETQKLENFYEKQIPNEQRKIWFSEFKKINITRYRYIIGQAYRQCKFMPKLADMIEINKTAGVIQQQEDETVYCPKCNGIGLILYKKKFNDNIYDMVCRCDCINGMKICKEIPTIQEIGIMKEKK